MFNNVFFRKSCHLRDNVKKKSLSRTGHRRKYGTCALHWILKATNTHSEYVILIAFPLQESLHEGTSTLRYTHIACLVSTTYSVSHSLPNPAFL